MVESLFLEFFYLHKSIIAIVTRVSTLQVFLAKCQSFFVRHARIRDNGILNRHARVQDNG